MLSVEQNDLLTRVEGDAPMGQLIRRYWLPACLSEEVMEKDGAPVRVRLMGEDLVAFRDSSGAVGLVGEHCPHRGASLFFGRNEGCGLRCLFHGWKVDVNGNVVETPAEQERSTMKDRAKHKSYPTREAGGFVWTYMGPPAVMPEFRPPVFALNPHAKISILKTQVDCNWAQGVEGALDSSHSSNLHSTDMPPAMVGRATATNVSWPRPTTDKAPRMQSERTKYGFRYAAIRKPIVNAQAQDYLRITLFLAPLTVLIPPNDVYNVSQMNVPVDDTHHTLYIMAWSDTGPGVEQDTWREFAGQSIGADLDKTYRKLLRNEQNYGQDRSVMDESNFTGIRGFVNQDIAMWESMGAIAQRDQDRLGGSDIGLAEFRRTMLAAVQDFMAGGTPLGLGLPSEDYAGLRSFEGMVPKNVDWRTMAAAKPVAAE